MGGLGDDHMNNVSVLVGFSGEARRGLRRTALLLSATAGLACGVPAMAQNAGDVAPPTRDELTAGANRPQPREAVTLTVDGQMERRACALDDPDYADLTIRLTSVSYSNSERAVDVALDKAHEGYLNRDLPVRALCDIRNRAAALLDDAGYLAAVEIPAQNLGGGEARFEVILGRLVAVRARGDTEGVEKRLAAYLGKLVGRDVFNADDAERYLLLANDIPGTNVRLSLRPAAGGQPGDLVGEIAVLQRAYLADLTVQNLGSRALGRFSALARGEAYNILGMGDRTSLAAFTSLDFDEQQTLQLGQDVLIGGEGLKIGGQLTFGWTNPSTLPGFDVTSDTLLASLEGSYPFLRTQEASVWGAVGFDLVNQSVDINGNPLTRDRVRTAFLRANFETVDGDSISRRNGFSPYEPRLRVGGEVELRHGLDVFETSRDCRSNFASCLTGGSIPPSRIEQDPTPFYIRGRVSGEFRPTPIWTIAFDLRGQFSDTPLPAFEEFSAGNFSVGRGFDPGALLGDSGVGAGLELRYGSLQPKTQDELAIQPYVFLDMAHAWQEDPSASPTVPDSLISMGGGARFVKTANFMGDLLVAVPVRKDGNTTVRDVRVLFTLTARIAPWRSRR